MEKEMKKILKRIVCAPISRNNQEALYNFEHEVTEAQNFRPVMWYGDVNGKDQDSDYFGFVDRELDVIHVHKVIKVLGPSAGRLHWSGKSNKLSSSNKPKNVLLMEPASVTIDFTQLLFDAEYPGWKNFVLNSNRRLKFPY